MRLFYGGGFWGREKMAVSAYIQKCIEKSPETVIPFQDFKIDDYSGPLLGGRDVLFTVVWRFASQHIPNGDAIMCFTPLLPYFGYQGKFYNQQWSLTRQAKETDVQNIWSEG